MVPRTKGKSGENWKKLHKSLHRDVVQAGPRVRKAYGKVHNTKKGEPAVSALSERVDHMADQASETVEQTSASSLPWFADEMSEQDLSVLMQSQLPSRGHQDVRESSEDALLQTGPFSEKARLSEAKGEVGRYVAIDCEMVGVGPNGSESALARVSLVNWHGVQILDTFVKAQEKVTDYRTWISGVRPKDLKSAPRFNEVQKKVADILKDRILIGHAIHNDLNALLLSHPRHLIRDTATYTGARSLANTKFPSLRKLVQLRLGLEIQKQGTAHSSLEDARATMAVYRTFHEQWQQELKSGPFGQHKKVKSTASSSSKQHIIGQGWKANGRKPRPKQADVARSHNEHAGKSTERLKEKDWWQTL